MSKEVKLVMKDTSMKRKVIDAFVEKAKACEPVLLERHVRAKSLVAAERCANGKVATKLVADASRMSRYPMKKGDSICLDFGSHYVGYVTLKFSSVGSPPDAPAYIRLKFSEVAKELLEDSADYDGWISRSWIQEEFLHIDVLPATISLPRRYAFRYLEIHTIDTSVKWELVLEDAQLRAVSAVDGTAVTPGGFGDKLLDEIDRVSLRTLENCMHSVFEDGPKRDRRLWIGDLRLQALANYDTYGQNDLVKRCLYLFGGLLRDDGRVAACLFIQPEYIADDTFFFDYSLFFISCLYDYYKATGDREVLDDLWPCALKQVELASRCFDEEHRYVSNGLTDSFIDWKAGLDKQAASQAIYIYCVKQAAELAAMVGDHAALTMLEREGADKAAAAMTHFWDEKQGVFVSGEARQVSYASQAWMVLAGVPTAEQGRRALLQVLESKPEMGMVSPYMNHHFVEALLQVGEKERAMEYLKYYWGGMVAEGADTFWELYNPEDPEESPYGSSMVNSYCHAWSCTPAYLLRKYFGE